MSYSIEPLFQSFNLGPLTLRSRFVMSPMTRSFSPQGVPGQNVADYYRRRAEADVGLIITEGVGIDHPSAIGGGPGALGEENIPMMYGDAALAGWKNVVDAVHAAGGLIMPQLWHMGVMRIPGTGLYKDAPSLRPSGLWGPEGKAVLPPDYLSQMLPPTQAMTESDIADIIAAYARSAANARAVGFDGIAIHGAHGYLMDSFFWAETNKRSDRWGGDLVQRTRFGAEVIRAIRKAVGPELPIVLRWSQWKQQDYDARLAQTPAELELFLRPLIDAGVDLFDTSTRVYSAPAFEGSDLTLAGWVRKLTGQPTMAVGGIGLSKDLQSSFAGGTVPINNLDQALAHFERGEFDLLAVGRSLLMDPQWAIKARANEPFNPFSLEHYGKLY
ncbi:MAG: 1,2-oxophytodienoate reductase [Gammaproteobacteria bacterium BRH_c0]|nr:MAG: 1,2-oxophytodienoate reductase [Gammaproteobacteria bacterium BRH_c0]